VNNVYALQTEGANKFLQQVSYNHEASDFEAVALTGQSCLRQIMPSLARTRRLGGYWQWMRPSYWTKIVFASDSMDHCTSTHNRFSPALRCLAAPNNIQFRLGVNSLHM
jgi:hypothetical protein